jgi:hypothetical protein
LLDLPLQCAKLPLELCRQIVEILSRHALAELAEHIRHLASFSCKACFSRSASICPSPLGTRKVQPGMRAKQLHTLNFFQACDLPAKLENCFH